MAGQLLHRTGAGCHTVNRIRSFSFRDLQLGVSGPAKVTCASGGNAANNELWRELETITDRAESYAQDGDYYRAIRTLGNALQRQAKAYEALCKYVWDVTTYVVHNLEGDPDEEEPHYDFENWLEDANADA